MRFTDVEKFKETLRKSAYVKCSTQWDYDFHAELGPDDEWLYKLSLSFKDKRTGEGVWEQDWMTVREEELPILMEIFNNVLI